MKTYEPEALVKMHGPSFDGSGKIVERDVPRKDYAAYRSAGYEEGPLPESVLVKNELAAIKEEVKATWQAKPKAKSK